MLFDEPTTVSNMCAVLTLKHVSVGFTLTACCCSFQAAKECFLIDLNET